MRRSIVGVAALAAGLTATGLAVAEIYGGVPDANQRVGSPLNVIATGYSLKPRAHGTDRLENPTGIYTRYGYLNDSATQTDHQDTKTEPDQNTYLVTHDNPGGPDHGYDYGRHFLIQGHEVFTTGPGGAGRAYLTRINLDVKDPNHRITLLNKPAADNDSGMTSLDGSTYDPFTGDLLFTGEGGTHSGVVSTPLRWSSSATPPLTHYDGSMGTGGFEGIQNDRDGNLMIVEDVGGGVVTDNGNGTAVKQPNSFVFRFKPEHKSDLSRGVLQVLQISVAPGQPIVFHDPQGARDDALGEPIRVLHSGQKLDAKWIKVHDTATDGTATFNANTLAKAKGGTPLKRPENGKFVPGTDFRSFVFAETGDTSNVAGTYLGAAARGAWGALLRIDMPKTGADTATVKTILNGDSIHNSFDNVTFADRSRVLIGEDRGDTLHQQLNALDSLWQFDTHQPLDQIVADGRRVIAQGRDPESSSDVALKEGGAGTHNDGDNEVTGIDVSNGSTSPSGLLGALDPGEGKGWRVFVTGQHGANVTFEIVKPDRHGHDHHR